AGEVGVDPHLDRLALTPRPGPVRKDVQHGLGAPPGFVVVEVVFRKAAGVHDTEVRADTGPGVRRRLAAIVEAGPYETAGEPTPRIESTPPLLGGGAVALWLVDVVGAHVTALRVVG